MNYRDIILKALNRPYTHTISDIRKVTKLNSDIIIKELNELVKENKVYVNEKKNLFYLCYQGIIEVKDKGFGFIKVEGIDEEFHVDEDSTMGALSGDTVDFYVLPKDRSKHLDSAIVTKIVNHSNDYVYGLLCQKKNKSGVSYYIDSHKVDFDIKAEVNETRLNGAIPGNIVVAKILDYISPKKVYCEITKILGYKDDPGVEISLIAEQHGFVTEFSKETMEEIKKLPNEIDPKDYPDRKDYSNLSIITIDGKDSKDFDDAVYVEKNNKGYHIIVCIADVSYYVKEGSSLDADAYKRGTSVYLADRVIPMLPQKLSNGICSLNPLECRLCDACEMDIDFDGKLLNYSLHEGIMKSHYRMTYEDTNMIFDGDISLKEKYQDIYNMLIDMLEASNVIRKRRTSKGAIEFDTPEYKVKLDEAGEPIEFSLRTRGKAEMMIEDLMLITNETVAYHLNISELPCMYRVHETPEKERVENVFNLINNLTGHKVRIPKNDVLPMDVQKVMDLVKDSPSYMAINTLMLRAMKKARYSDECLGHYGLALKYYCHFTSPIRRYPDLIVHRILKQLIFHPEQFIYKMNDFNFYMHEAAIDTSNREKAAIECEREVDDMLAAKYMTKHCGIAYEGIVSSVTSFGMFVMLDNGIEGLIHVSNMNGRFDLNDKLMELQGRHKTYKIGQKVEIVCVASNVKDRKIDFVLKEDYDEDIDFGKRNMYK